MPFADYLLEWLEIVKVRVKATTFSSYEQMVKSVIEPYKIIAGDRFHLFTPFLWGISVVFSLSAKVTVERPPATRQTPLF